MKGKGDFWKASGRTTRRVYLVGIFDRRGRRPTRRAKSRNGAAGDLPTDRPTDGNGPDIHTRSFRNASKEEGEIGREGEGERKEGKAAEEEENRLLSRSPRRSFPCPARSKRNKASVNSSVREMELGLKFGSMLGAIAREFKRRACLIGE